MGTRDSSFAPCLRIRSMSTREGLKHDRFLWCSCALARIDSSDCRTDRGTIARTSTIQWPRTRVEAMDECVSHRNRPELALPGTDHPVTSELASNESVDRWPKLEELAVRHNIQCPISQCRLRGFVGWWDYMDWPTFNSSRS